MWWKLDAFTLCREPGFGHQPQSVMNGYLKPTLMLAPYRSRLSALFIYHESGILPSSLGSGEGHEPEKEELKKRSLLTQTPNLHKCLCSGNYPQRGSSFNGSNLRTGSYPFNYLTGRKKLKQGTVEVVVKPRCHSSEGIHLFWWRYLLDGLGGLTFDHLNNSVFRLQALQPLSGQLHCPSLRGHYLLPKCWQQVWRDPIRLPFGHNGGRWDGC